MCFLIKTSRQRKKKKWKKRGKKVTNSVFLSLTQTFQGVESSSDVALYSGLAAGVVTVVLLIVAVTLYRRSQSEYGVDVIDSSALTGGFQSFSFKTSRQGETATTTQTPPQQTVI